MGAAIMMLPYGDDDQKGGGLKIASLLARLKNAMPQFPADPALAPIPVKGKIQPK